MARGTGGRGPLVVWMQFKARPKGRMGLKRRDCLLIDKSAHRLRNEHCHDLYCRQHGHGGAHCSLHCEILDLI
eukprot:3873685-Rhodomonas_salina.2